MTRDLVERARKGDHDAFAELAGAAISRLDATAWLMLRDADRATDAVQNALVRAWRDLPTLRDPDRFDAWLHRLLVNACIDEIRRVRRRRFDVDVTDLSIPARPSRTPRRSSPTATSSNARFSRLEPEERAVDRPASLPRPAVAGGRRDAAGSPWAPTKSRLYRGLREMRAALDADARPGPDIREGRPA